MVLQYCFESLTYSQDSLPLYSYNLSKHSDSNRDSSISSYDPETPFRGCGRESEVIAILCGDDLRLIQLLGRFRFFRDEELRRSLEDQSERQLDVLIAYFRSSGKRDGLADPPTLTRDQKVEKILCQLKPSVPVPTFTFA